MGEYKFGLVQEGYGSSMKLVLCEIYWSDKGVKMGYRPVHPSDLNPDNMNKVFNDLRWSFIAGQTFHQDDFIDKFQ